MNLSKSYQELSRASIGRILVMDGDYVASFGTQSLTEQDFRGNEFADHPVSLEGNFEVLCLTAPARVKEMHRAYLESGVDLVRTVTRNANAHGQAEYRLDKMAYDIANAGAELARQAVKEYNDDILNSRAGKLGQVPERKFVVGCMGASARRAPFRDLVDCYGEQARGLLDGGADVLMLENISNSLDAKAALYAVLKICNERGMLYPIIVSALVSDSGAHLASGLGVGALRHSVSSFPIFGLGVECASEVSDILPSLRDFSLASVRVSAFVDFERLCAGVAANALERALAEEMWKLADSRVVNIVGGGRGSSPARVKTVVKALRGCRPRKIPARSYSTLLSGLDALDVSKQNDVVVIGKQSCDAKVIAVDVDVDEKEAKKIMESQLDGLLLQDESARLPVMVSSERWDALVAGMECVLGKGIARSVSLREGEEVFLYKAEEIRKHGFAAVFRAEDEEGEATTFERQSAIMERMYRLLIGKLAFHAEDVLFEPNVPASDIDLASGIETFFRICKFVKVNLPYAHILCDISKIGRLFEGDDSLRGVFHSVFLHHARKAGLDFVLVDSKLEPAYDEIPYRLCCLVENLMFNRESDAMEKLREFVVASRK